MFWNRPSMLAGHVGEVAALGQLLFHVGSIIRTTSWRLGTLARQAEDPICRPRPGGRVLVGLAPHRDTVEVLHVFEGLLQAGDPAVDGDGQIRIILFDPVDAG